MDRDIGRLIQRATPGRLIAFGIENDCPLRTELPGRKHSKGAAFIDFMFPIGLRIYVEKVYKDFYRCIERLDLCELSTKSNEDLAPWDQCPPLACDLTERDWYIEIYIGRHSANYNMPPNNICLWRCEYKQIRSFLLDSPGMTGIQMFLAEKEHREQYSKDDKYIRIFVAGGPDSDINLKFIVKTNKDNDNYTQFHEEKYEKLREEILNSEGFTEHLKAVFSQYSSAEVKELHRESGSVQNHTMQKLDLERLLLTVNSSMWEQLL